MALSCSSCGSLVEASDKFCAQCGTPTRRATSAPPAVSDSLLQSTERRFVSVLFADLVGYTPFSEHRDPEEVRDFLIRYFEAARDIVGRFGGIVDKFIGDAVMAVWGAQVANEDDAERAVRAALELIDMVAKLAADAGVPDLSLRAGISTGEAAVGPGGNEQGLVVGDIVNIAARLQTAAPPGALIVSEPTERAARRAIEFDPIGELSVKGKTQPVAGWRAIRVVALVGGELRADSLEAPFVGRERELRLLKELLQATALDSRVRLVSIVGLAGVGKSRLVWELEKYIDGLVEDIYWHVGRSPAYGEGVTFWALGEMVRGRCGIAEGEDPARAAALLEETLTQHVEDPSERDWLRPRLAGLLGLAEMPAGERGELFAAWRAFFARLARRGCTVLVFEELHWADGGLLDFIEELPDWSRDDPILVVTLARPELLDRRPGWGSGHADNVSIHLGPLNDESMAQLVSGLLPGLGQDAVVALTARAAGFPLYAVELIRMLVNEGQVVETDGGYRLTKPLSANTVPESLLSVIGARLDRLDRPARALLQDASVLGQSFRLELLSSLLDVVPDELRGRLSDLVRREFLEVRRDPRAPDRGQYSFVQALIRDVAYGRLSRPDRYHGHLRAAQYLETQDEGDLAGVVASHYLSARDASRGPDRDQLTELATRALRGAVERAISMHSYEQALGLSQRALLLVENDVERLWFLERAATSAHKDEEEDLAEDLARRALAIESGSNDDASYGRLNKLLAEVLNALGRSDEAIKCLENVLSHIGPAESPHKIAASAELARTYLIASRYDLAAETAKGAASAAKRLGVPAVIVDALITRGSALWSSGRLDDGEALLREALALALEYELPTASLRAVNNLSYILDFEDPRSCLSLLTEGMTTAEKVGERYWAELMAASLSDIFLEVGDLAAAHALIEQSEPKFKNLEFIDYLKANKIHLAALIGDRVGNVPTAAELLPTLEESFDPDIRHLANRTIGWLHLLAGSPMRAFDETLDFLAGMQVGELPRLIDLPAHAAVWSGDIARVQKAQGLAKTGARPGQVFAVFVLHLDSVAALMSGTDKGGDVAAVAEQFLSLGLLVDSFMTWAELALLTPDFDLAEDADRRARAGFAAIGAGGLLKLYERTLALKGHEINPAR
jgi:class 3 adenylate cyclase/tetratricopeptide (TPR) repeat protein